MFKRLIKYIVIFVISIMGLFEGCYAYKSNNYASQIQPSFQGFPEEVKQVFWASISDRKVRALEPFFLHRFMAFFTNPDYFRPPWIAQNIVRSKLASKNNWKKESNIAHHINSIIRMTWISRNWSADQAISTVLVNGYFGHGCFGMEKAAITYYNLSLTELQTEEIAMLIILNRGTHYYNPWKKRIRVINRAKVLLEKINHYTFPDSATFERKLFERLVKEPKRRKAQTNES